jgi:hypothetical protein
VATLINAQSNIDWPATGKYRLDTLSSKINISKLVIAAGAYGQGSYAQPLLVDYGAYSYARFRFAKIAALSAYVNQGFADMTNGGGITNQQEGTATIFYYNKIDRDKGVKVLKVDRYSDQKTTTSAPYDYPSGFFPGLNVGLINKKYFAPLVAENGVIKNTINDSAVSFKSAVTQVNTQMLSFGLSVSTCSKFKGKLYYTDKNGSHRKYNIRKNTSMDMTLQCLMALNTSANTNLFSINEKNTPSDIAFRSFTPQGYKKLGWRMLMVMRMNSVISINVQAGSLPGVKLSKVKGFATLAENLFVQIGFGFGIGAF